MSFPWVRAFLSEEGQQQRWVEAPGGRGGGGEEEEAEAEGVHGWLRRGEPGPASALHGGVQPHISMDVVDETEALQRFFEGKWLNLESLQAAPDSVLDGQINK